MFRLIFWLFSLAMMVVVVAMAAGNRALVTLNLDPVPYLVDAPLYMVVLASVALGFVWGLLASLAAVFKAKRRAHEKAWDAAKVRRENADLRQHIETLEAARLAALPSSPPVLKP
ncbi:MAG: LapA family protein [Magnetospirillum sp. WYHS-4]